MICFLRKNQQKKVTKRYVLNDFIDPKPSIQAIQHKFINKMQKEESIPKFNRELKKLSKDCNFIYECGKSIADNYMKIKLE